MMTIQELKAAQIEQFKNLVVSYFKTDSDAPWKEAKYTKIEGISSFLKATGVLTDELENDIIQQAQQ